MAHLFRRPPGADSEPLPLGLTPEDFATAAPSPLLAPDLAESVTLFCSLITQWRMGFSGAVGLDYGVIPATLRLMGYPRQAWPDLFDDLRVMEFAALKALRT